MQQRPTTLLALSAFLTLASGAEAQNSEFFMGLEYTPLGQATLTPGGGRLMISNLGSSGCDGVSVDLGESAGYVNMVDPAFISPVGATTDWEAYGTLDGNPERLLFRVQREILVAGSQSGDTVWTRVSEDASPMGATGYDVQAFDLDGNSLYHAVLPNGPLYDFPSVVNDHGENGGCVVQEWDIDENGTITCNEIMPDSPLDLVFADGAHVADVHRIELHGVQASSTPSRPLSRVDTRALGIQSMSLTMEALIEFGHHVSGVDEAHIAAQGGPQRKLKVSNLGSSGCDGFSIAAPDSEHIMVAWEPLAPAVNPGTVVEVETLGERVSGPGSCGMTHLRSGPANDALIDADYSATGASMARVTVLAAGQEIVSVVTQTGNVASASSWPEAVGKRIAWAPAAKPCYYYCWPILTGITIPGTGTFQGDELRVVAADGEDVRSIDKCIVRLANVSADVFVTDIRSDRVCELRAERHCTALANSTGLPARIDARGCSVVAENDLELITSDMPANTFGLYFFGPNRIQAPFGNGRRCVGGATQRLQGPQQSDASGVLARVVDLSAAPAAGILVPGAVQSFQLWFRDTMAGGARFNLSDSIEISFD